MVRQDAWMILQIFPDSRHISHHPNPHLLEMLAWPNPGEQEQLGGIDGATGQDNLLLRPELLFAAIFERGDPHRTGALKKDLRRQRVGPDGEIGAMPHGMQIANGGAVPIASADGALNRAEAFL